MFIKFDVIYGINQLHEYLQGISQENVALSPDNALAKCFTRSASAEKMHYHDASGSVEQHNSPYIYPSISIYDAYAWYCIHNAQQRQMKSLLVSKLYFEKYVLETLSPYIIDNKYISMSWWMK